MAASKDEMKGVMGEHEAIRAHMDFLIKSLSGLAKPSTPVKDHMRNYRLGLYDFRDGLRRHIEMDERIFQKLLGSVLLAETLREHEEIRKQADDIIRLADSAIESKLDREVQKQVLSVREAFNRISELIKTHTAKEDELLKLVQKDL